MSNIYLSVMLLAMSVTAQEQVVATTPPTDYNALYGQIVLLVSGIIGFIYTIYRENRNRAWDVADRKERAADIAKQLEDARAQLAERAAHSHDAVVAKIEANTQMTERAVAGADAAYMQANAVNEKIAAITNIFGSATQERLAKLEQPTETLDTLKRMSESIQETLNQIQKVP